MENILLARQAIYDRELQVIAYDLLYRMGEVRDREVFEPEQTANLILNVFGDLGVERVTGNYPVLIHMPAQIIREGLHMTLPKENAIIKIDLCEKLDDHSIAVLEQLGEMGYKLALDNYDHSDEHRVLAEMATMVELDLTRLPESTIGAAVRYLKSQSIFVVGENLNDYDAMGYALSLGCDGLSGKFLSKPSIIQGKQVSANRNVVMELVAGLQKPDITMEEIECAISRDPILSYKLLRVVNAAGVKGVRQIESLKEAVIRLGLARIRSWITLIALANVDDKPFDLIIETMMRARICECIAKELGRKNIDRYFTVGLFSMLDAVLDGNLANLISELPLTEELKTAIINHDGDMGKVLNDAIACMDGTWEKLCHEHLGTDAYRDIYMESIHWVDTTCNSLLDD